MSDCTVCDAVNADDKRLKLKWAMMAGPDWSTNWSIVNVGDITIMARPGSYRGESASGYCAWINWGEDTLLHQDDFPTRLDAQIGAEALLKEMHDILGAAMKGKQIKVKITGKPEKEKVK